MFKAWHVQERSCNVQRGVRLIAMCVRSFPSFEAVRKVQAELAMPTKPHKSLNRVCKLLRTIQVRINGLSLACLLPPPLLLLLACCYSNVSSFRMQYEIRPDNGWSDVVRYSAIIGPPLTVHHILVSVKRRVIQWLLVLCRALSGHILCLLDAKYLRHSYP